MVNTILNDDERRALMVRYGSSATPDENNDYMTGDYPLVCATEAAVLAKLRKQEPVYQIKAFNSQTAWHDATEGAYHVVPPSDRRIVYAAPLPAVVQVPPGYKLVPVELLHRVLDSETVGGMSDASDELRELLAAAPEAPANGPSGAVHRAALIQIGQAALKAGWREGELADFVAAKLAAPEAPAQPSVPAPWREAVKVMREALATVQASIVEEGISAGRREYRSELFTRMAAALRQLDSLEGGE